MFVAVESRVDPATGMTVHTDDIRKVVDPVLAKSDHRHMTIETDHFTVDRAGPVVTAVVMNLEPLITIGLAVILLGEHVSAVQLGGAALVVTAIAIMRR